MCNCILWILLLTILIMLLEITALPHLSDNINSHSRNNTNFKRSNGKNGTTWKNHPDNDKKNLSAREKRESDIIFSEEDIMFTDLPKPPPTNCTKRSTFCEDVEEYPEDYIHRALSREAEKYEELFGVDFVIPAEDIQNRFSGNAVEETLCASTEELVFPKEGETRDGDWLYIINTKNYAQGVRIELCSHQNDKCSFTNNFPNGYESKCVQKYIYRELLGLDRQGKTSKMTFKLPSCCQCILTHERGYE